MDGTTVTPMITETSTNEVYNFIPIQHTPNEAQPTQMETTVHTERMEQDAQPIETPKEIRTQTTTVDQTQQFDQNILQMAPGNFSF